MRATATGGRRRRLPFWPAAIASLLILLMPAMSRSGIPAAGSLQANICSAGGPHYLTLDSTGHPVRDTTPSHAGICWFCFAHPGWLPARELQQALPYAMAAVSMATPRATGTRPARDFLIGRRTRAPPTRSF